MSVGLLPILENVGWPASRISFIGGYPYHLLHPKNVEPKMRIVFKSVCLSKGACSNSILVFMVLFCTS